jgi:putative oxidoreductase
MGGRNEHHNRNDSPQAQALKPRCADRAGKRTDQTIIGIRRLLAARQRTASRSLLERSFDPGHEGDFPAVIRRMGQQTDNGETRPPPALGGNMLLRILATDSSWVPTLARIILGIIFFAHGSQKVLGWFGGPGLRQTLRTLTEVIGLPTIIALAAVGAEFVGGAALILGLAARLSALVIAVNMLAAIFMVHGKYGLFMNWFGDRKGHGIEYHLLALAVAIVVIAQGAGAFSLDRLLSNLIGA